jgi:toxin FitB
MFVLDTNILSAMMSARPAPKLAAWIARQPEDALFTATVPVVWTVSGENKLRLVAGG